MSRRRPDLSSTMERFRSLLLTRTLACALMSALLATIAGSYPTKPAADHMVDRVARTFAGDEAVVSAAATAAAGAPASFDEFLVSFIGVLEEASGSAGEILIGQNMSQTRLLDLLRQRFSDELAPAVSPRQFLSVATPASTPTRERSTTAAAEIERRTASVSTGSVIADASVTARVISCGYRCSSVQPLGP